MRERLAGWSITSITDGGLIATTPDAGPAGVRLLLVVHVDEIGGMVGEALGRSNYAARCWGAPPRMAISHKLVGPPSDDAKTTLLPSGVKLG